MERVAGVDHTCTEMVQDAASDSDVEPEQSCASEQTNATCSFVSWLSLSTKHLSQDLQYTLWCHTDCGPG